MSLLTRVVNRLRPRGLERDLRDEVDFHLEMRANENLNGGMHADEATEKAHDRFGDVDAVVAAMRRERLASPARLLAMTALLLALVAAWTAQERIRSRDLMMPVAPAAPNRPDPDRPSGLAAAPRPGPGPTWEQYVKQTKAFEALQKGPGTYSPGTVIDDKTHPR